MYTILPLCFTGQSVSGAGESTPFCLCVSLDGLSQGLVSIVYRTMCLCHGLLTVYVRLLDGLPSACLRDIYAGLDSNYCRNPGDGFRPWCFTNATDCQRAYCDVCQLGKCHGQSISQSLHQSLTQMLSQKVTALTYSSAHSLTRSLIYSIMHSLTHSCILSLTHSLTHLLTRSLTHALIHALFFSHAHSLTYSLTYPLTQSYINLLTYSSIPSRTD